MIRMAIILPETDVKVRMRNYRKNDDLFTSDQYLLITADSKPIGGVEFTIATATAVRELMAVRT